MDKFISDLVCEIQDFHESKLDESNGVPFEKDNDGLYNIIWKWLIEHKDSIDSTSKEDLKLL